MSYQSENPVEVDNIDPLTKLTLATAITLGANLLEELVGTALTRGESSADTIELMAAAINSELPI